MAELHRSLEQLSRTDWDDVPTDTLNTYLSQCFSAGELLCNSVPPPANGTAFDSAEPHFTTPNSAKSAKEMYASPARQVEPHKDHGDLQKNWGKAMKFGQKENPLNTALYKMAGHDRHGAWFARHTILEGLGFAKFKKALQREFPETLLTVGEPGAGAKRGLSAERRLERRDVDNVGRLEVYQLSAQMPSPVTPREFLTLFLTTDQALTDKSAADTHTGDRHVPRHFMIVSRPLTHTDAPERDKFVRGHYESVEVIREIPLHASTPDLDPELNPVEWIMVTRSDPAGGVPRFLVDRGTPGAMLGDVTKFLDWACGQEEIPDGDEDLSKQQQMSDQAAQGMGQEGEATTSNVDGESANKPTVTESAEQTAREAAAPAAVAQDQTQNEGGLVSNMTSMFKAGVDTYAPVTVSNYMHNQLDTQQAADTSDSSDTSSIESFFSAEGLKQLSTAPEYQPQESTENLSIASAASSGNLSGKTDKKNMSRHDKEILSIMKQREKLDQKLAKKREAEESKLKESQQKDSSNQDKAKEKMDREMQKTEERHKKEVEKLEAKRDREARKAEERRKKKDDHNKLSLVARERDDFRNQGRLLRKENTLLAEQVENLQRENAALTSRLGKVGGLEVVQSVRDEISKGRSKSDLSLASGDSGGSGKKRDL